MVSFADVYRKNLANKYSPLKYSSASSNKGTSYLTTPKITSISHPSTSSGSNKGSPSTSSGSNKGSMSKIKNIVSLASPPAAIFTIGNYLNQASQNFVKDKYNQYYDFRTGLLTDKLNYTKNITDLKTATDLYGTSIWENLGLSPKSDAEKIIQAQAGQNVYQKEYIETRTISEKLGEQAASQGFTIPAASTETPDIEKSTYLKYGLIAAGIIALIFMFKRNK